MFAYLTILSTAIAGLAGVTPLVILAGAAILTGISATMHRDIYRRASETAGGRALALDTLAQSAMNGCVACGAAWTLGYALRVIA
ncbi:MAG: hypothetical protein NW216_07495 [Hyphomicrobium sp.]|nr:hypothetical protein [Hyphomicrobium sp.]